MKDLQYHINQFEPRHDKELLKLERQSPQGKRMKFEMVRDSYLRRSDVFDKYSIFVATEKQSEQIIGVSAISIVPVCHENKSFNAGFGYDLRVEPAYRRKGISKSLGERMTEYYHSNQNVTKYFTTLKSNNTAVAKAALVIPGEWVSYDFVYLTIPSYKKVSPTKPKTQNQFFITSLLSKPLDNEKYIIKTPTGLGIWKTYEMYSLKIIEMPWYLQLGSKLINWVLPRGRKIPSKGDILQFATLFNFNPENISHINEALSILQEQNIQYLNVCCTPDDFAYRMLKPYSINELSYSMLNNFGVKNGSHLTMDVRCL
jgi:GNAT superfamily N-acetyltransferase